MFEGLLPVVVGSMGKRGGPRRSSVPEVDVARLTADIDEYIRSRGVAKALFFGIYNHIYRSHAVDAEGIAFNRDFLRIVLRKLYIKNRKKFCI